MNSSFVMPQTIAGSERDTYIFNSIELYWIEGEHLLYVVSRQVSVALKQMCCIVPFPTWLTALCVWIFSWPICVMNTQRAWSGVCFNSVCPCYFRVTLSCENTAGKKHAKHKRAPCTCFSSLCLFTRTPGHLYKSFQRVEKVPQFVLKLWGEKLYWSQHHIWGWLSTGRESLMKPLQSLGRWRPLIAIIAVMKLTIRSYLRVRARCHRNQERLGEVKVLT